MKNKKLIIIFILLALSGAVSWNTYLKEYNQEDTVDIHIFPKEIAGWTSEELPITEDEYAILETRNVFARKYKGPKGQEIYFFTIYSQYNRKVSHPPEVCYTGSGVKVASNVVETVDVASDRTIDMHKLLLEHKLYRQIAYYWFKIGESYTPSYWKQQITITVNNLIGKPKGSALIRVSAGIRSTPEAAEADIKEFIRLIYPKLNQYLP